jgi:integrase
MMASLTIAANVNLKYALECGAAKTTPPDNDYSDPIYKTKIAVTDKVIFVVHYAASGETYMLRHSTGYKLANQGEDTRSLAHYLGHRNLQSTARYTALAPDRFAGFWKD